MIRRLTGIITAAALTLPLIPASMPMASAAGEITSISSLSELQSFRDSVNNGADYSGVTVKLKNNISGLGSWTPIGDEDHPFKGTFDGKGHSISGITGFSGSSDYNGLFGYIVDGTIKNLGVDGSVSNSGYATGGIAGAMTGGNAEISCCHSNVTISSSNGITESSVGGIAGYNASGTIINCYNTGSVAATYNVGGIVGKLAYGNVSCCHNQGTVTMNPNGADAGSLIGDDSSYGGIRNCYYPAGDMPAIGNGTLEQTKALSTSEMKEQSSFTGFDFTSVWKMGDNYPVLDFDKLCAWDDHIEDLDELMQLRDWVNDGTLLTQYPAFTTYYLDNDIDMSSIDNWTPIGNSSSHPFTITFDGQEHTISNLKVEGASGYEGLFGLVKGNIINLNVSGTVKGNIEAGLIAARISGISTQKASIQHCTANGTVTGRNSIGGIVGAVSGYVDMIRCEYTGGQLSADDTVGGIAGFVSGTTDTSTGTWFGNCVNSYGNIAAANSKAGGIAGYANNNVIFSQCEYKGRRYVTAPNSAGGIAGSLEAALSYAPSVRDCSSADTAYVSGKTNIGGIVGKTSKANSSTTASVAVSRCTNAAEVISNIDEREAGVTQNYGGIVGSNGGSVTDCTAKGFVYGHDNVGGIVGKNDNDAVVSGCVNEREAAGETTGSDSIGGIAGLNNGTVTGYCHNSGTVKKGVNIGGIVGKNTSTVELSYNTGNIGENNSSSRNTNVGGVVGSNATSATLQNCYNAGTVEGNVVGGAAGINYGTVENCHNITLVEGTGAGGIVGGNESGGKVISCYYMLGDNIVYPINKGDVDLISGKKSADEFLDETTFANWDFNNTSIWTINKTLGAPDFFDMKLTYNGDKSTGYYTDSNDVYHKNATGFIVNFKNGEVSPKKAYVGWKVTPEGGETITFEPSEITGMNIGDGTEIVIGLVVTELEDENAELKAYALYE